MELRIYQADKILTHASLHGRMDYAGIKALEEGFYAITAGRNRSAVIELEDVTFMVSIGMRMLIEVAKTLAETNCQLILTGPRGLVKEALAIARLDEIFTIVDTPDEALRLLRDG